MNRRHFAPAALTMLTLVANVGCSKRPADPGRPPVEATNPSPASAQAEASPGSPAPARAATTGAVCRGEPLPADQHYVAAGLCATLVAKKQGKLRDIEFLPNGDLIGVKKDGEIVRYRDTNQNGVFDVDTPEIVEWANTGGENGHSCHFFAEFLYCGSKDGVKRFRYTPEIQKGGPGEDVVVGVPSGGRHPIHSVKAYDGYLYVVSASDDNAKEPMPADYDTNRAVLKRFKLADFTSGKPFPWSKGEVWVTGIRNATAFGRGPTGRLYGVINNLDHVHYADVDVHEDNPGDIVIALDKGKRYGFPFCFHAASVMQDGKLVAPGTPLKSDVKKEGPLAGMLRSNKDDAWCAKNADRPLSFVQAHSSVLDLEFVPASSKALPERYRGGAFVTLHGSWDRKQSTGQKVVWLPFDEKGNPPMPTATADAIQYPYEVVFGGGKRGAHKDGDWSWKGDAGGESSVRPVGLAISSDGALYVSSDNAPIGIALPIGKNDGNIYRIAFER
jgi:glucose/arabinose dehydrogenase